jgi:hypothetical protein
VSSKTVARCSESGALKSSRTLGGHRRFLVQDLLSFARDENLKVNDALLRALGIEFDTAGRPPLTPDQPPPDWDLIKATGRLSERDRAVIILDSRGCEILLANGARVLDSTFEGAVWKAQQSLLRVA